jgi:hypothetical protein
MLILDIEVLVFNIKDLVFVIVVGVGMLVHVLVVVGEMTNV